jgi:hypothetical protein
VAAGYSEDVDHIRFLRLFETFTTIQTGVNAGSSNMKFMSSLSFVATAMATQLSELNCHATLQSLPGNHIKLPAQISEQQQC